MLAGAGGGGDRGPIRTIQGLGLGGAGVLPITSCATCILRVVGAGGVRVLIRHSRPAWGEDGSRMEERKERTSS